MSRDDVVEFDVEEVSDRSDLIRLRLVVDEFLEGLSAVITREEG